MIEHIIVLTCPNITTTTDTGIVNGIRLPEKTYSICRFVKTWTFQWKKFFYLFISQANGRGSVLFNRKPFSWLPIYFCVHLFFGFGVITYSSIVPHRSKTITNQYVMFLLVFQYGDNCISAFCFVFWEIFLRFGRGEYGWWGFVFWIVDCVPIAFKVGISGFVGLSLRFSFCRTYFGWLFLYGNLLVLVCLLQVGRFVVLYLEIWCARFEVRGLLF